MRRKINKYDIVLIAAIIIVNCFLLYYFSKSLAAPKESVAEIYSDNELVGEYKLKIGYEDEFSVKTQDGKGYNLIKIKNDHVWVEDANCPDKICIHQGEISSEGQIIACLPNKMMIKIRTSSFNEDEIDFYVQ